MSLVPGLYLSLLAIALAFALRRWWDPVPLRAWAAFGALLVVLFGPALFLGRVLLPADILPGVRGPEGEAEILGNPLQLDLVTQVAPLLSQVRRAVREGEWPLWTPLVGAGMPLLADPQSQALQPLALLALPLPLDQALGVTASLRVLVALVFFFLLMRRQGLGTGAALFGALAYGLSGFLLLWVGWPLANSAALLPLSLYALVMTAERGARRDFGLLTAAAASVLVAGHPETILYVVMVAALFAGARLLARGAAERGRLAARWALAGVIALGITAPALVPTVRFLPKTHRDSMVDRRNERIERQGLLAGWHSAAARRETGRTLGLRLAGVVAPGSLGNSRYWSYWGEANVNEDAAGFVGGAALLAALLAFVPGVRRLPQERLFLALAAVSFVVALRPPPLPRLLAELPVLNQSLSSHRRLFMVLAFALAYLGACAVERWQAGEGPRRRVVAGLAVALLGAVAWAYAAIEPPAGESPLPRLSWFSLAVQLGAVTLAAVTLLSRKKKGTLPAVLATLAALVALELVALHRPANPALPRDRFYPVTPAVAFLQANAGDSRILGLGDRLLPNAASVYGLADARISNPVKPFAYVQVVAPVAASTRRVEDIFVRPNHPVYQLLGVRYLIAPRKLQRVRPLRVVYQDQTTRIFERPAPLPRLFLPAAAEVPSAVPWPEWVAGNPDFAARSLVQPSAGRAVAWSAARPGGSEVRVLSLGAARLTATARLAEDRLLASSVYQDGGWRLLLDGRPRETVIANGPFAAAWLPPGEHRLELLYRPPGFVPGLLLAALACLAAGLWLVPRPETSPR
jgi:hypothetical protein